MLIGIRLWCLVAACAGAASAREWAWPEARESVRIDTKVRFLDDSRSDKTKRGDVQADDDAPFRPPTATDGFYNRPPDAGRFPVRVVPGQREEYHVNGASVYPVQGHKNDGTVDSIQYCKCVSTPDCNPRQDSAEVCGPGKYLCCFKRPNKSQQLNSEIFNEIEDERPSLYPGQEKLGGPFPPPPPAAENNPRGNDYFNLGVGDSRQNFKPILFGPGGPSGVVGPPQAPVLVGPNGPTGVIGPAPVNHNLQNSASAQNNILVGPGGPTGIIGPYRQGFLAGPRGPAGAIGPNRGGSRRVLVGPGGPTGIIGPSFGNYRQSNTGPGLLVGPGGPTGTIGPGRQLLVGPGGPTGRIGPQRYFESETKILSTSTTRTTTVQMVKNQTGTEFSRNPGMYARAADTRSTGSAASTDDDNTSQSHATAASSSQSHDTAGSHQRVRRGDCTRGCGNNPAPAPPMHIKKKGYRVKPPEIRVRRPNRKQKSEPKNRGCSRSDGGCGSAVEAPLPLPTPPALRRAGMGIGEYHPKLNRKRTKATPPTEQVNKALRAGNAKDKGQEVLSQLFSYMVSAYLDEMRAEEDGRITTIEYDRDMYGEIIITSPAPTTVKPSPFRKIPIFLAALKVVKALIVFGIL